MRFAGKTVVLCVTGGIAAYKAADLTSKLHQNGATVHVLMTESATQFIAPMTFETLSGNRAVVDTFDRSFPWEVEHISLAKAADVFVIAPATANVIAKAAHGIADDMVTTTLLATKAPVVVAPAMNTGMYDNPVTQENLAALRKRGFHIIEPDAGHLACGDSGRGKLPDTPTLLWGIEKALTEQDLAGRHVLVTAGPTQEAMDPVRYITNHSTGKMGYAIARNCMLRGADVTLVTGQTSIEKPRFVNIVPIESAREMFEEVTGRAPEQDIIIKAAAVADYRPQIVSDEKVKKSGDHMTLELEKTDDILKYLGEHKKEGQFLCGFSMETEHMLENSRAKLKKKNLDMIVANNLKQAGAGFGTDTNVITMITPEEEISLDLMSKEEAAGKILDEILKLRG